MDIQILAREFYDYSTFIKGYSKHTICRYKYVINLYCKVAEIKSLNEVTEENVRSLFFIGRTQRNWSTNTYLCFYKSLKVFFRWCVEKGCIEYNPVDKIDKPRIEQKTAY